MPGEIRDDAMRLLWAHKAMEANALARLSATRRATISGVLAAGGFATAVVVFGGGWPDSRCAGGLFPAWYIHVLYLVGTICLTGFPLSLIVFLESLLRLRRSRANHEELISFGEKYNRDLQQFDKPTTWRDVVRTLMLFGAPTLATALAVAASRLLATIYGNGGICG